MKRFFSFLKREPWVLSTIGILFSLTGLKFVWELPKAWIFTLDGIGLVLILIGAFFAYSKKDLDSDDE